MTRPPVPTKPLRIEVMPCVFPNAAGLDIGSSEIVAAVGADRSAEPVRAFGSFTPDLHALVDWLVSLGIDTVAMESTGVYWVPIYELLEQRGITPYLVTGRHVKMVPGRKSDWNDAQWLQKLHSLGLLRASFRPDVEICAFRTLVRYRAELIAHRVPHILHMQKALTQMNLQLSLVLSDITGVTGQAIVRAIVAGERDPARLAEFRASNCKASVQQITKALTGSLVSVTGLSASSVQTILSEVGTDMGRFPTVKHLASWLGLAPHNDISGGKVLRSRTLKVSSRAGQAFRQAAQSVARSASSFGAYFRAMRARKGPQQATVATAHKLARTVYFMLLRGEPFRAESEASYEEQRKKRELKQLTRRAQKLGFTLSPAPRSAAQPTSEAA